MNESLLSFGFEEKIKNYIRVYVYSCVDHARIYRFLNDKI